LGEPAASTNVSVTSVNFQEVPDVSINAAGPLLVQMDEARNRLVVANTLSSSMSIIDCATHRVENIPLGGRALQHLKSEAMTINRKTGDICLIGTKCFYIVSPKHGTARTIPTEAQFESIAVDEETGNVFIVGRESKSLGFYDSGSKRLKMKKWLDRREELINLNATPPPPIRKVVADSRLGQIVAVDGIEPAIYVFDARNGKKVRSHPIGLSSGGRWHLAGYDEKDHSLFIVVETAERKVIEAAKVGAVRGDEIIVALPGLSEGVGILYNPAREEVYIPYDNHPTVHVVDFSRKGTLDEIKIPAFGNDGSANDVEEDFLYIASWAHGEIDMIDLQERKLLKRITGLGIIPHMFSIAFNPNNGLLYFPKGATAVNGTFGTAVTVVDPKTEKREKIYTGWAPIDLIEVRNRRSFLVFNSEDQFAEVRSDGRYKIHQLPFEYPVRAILSPERDVYLSYGPHQSYWPTVYIWGAKNGVLTIDADDLSFYDRRIPRQAHEMVLDSEGVLYFTQNNWGKEKQFIGLLRDQVRVYEPNERITLEDDVSREITQRILRYDQMEDRIYLVRVGEKDDDPSMLQVVDPKAKEAVRKIPLRLTATDLLFDRENIYVTNFDSDTVSIVDKSLFTVREVATGAKPLKLCPSGDDVYVINHLGNTLQRIRVEGDTFEIPYSGLPDNLFEWGDRIVITSHSNEALSILEFDPRTESFSLLHREEYPFGDTRFDTRNVSFYVKGQFGDVVFDLTRGKTDEDGRLWITDFLSGRLYILERS
jgi:YVTN family beta-propeller protein